MKRSFVDVKKIISVLAVVCMVVGTAPVALAAKPGDRVEYHVTPTGNMKTGESNTVSETEVEPFSVDSDVNLASSGQVLVGYTDKDKKIRVASAGDLITVDTGMDGVYRMVQRLNISVDELEALYRDQLSQAQPPTTVEQVHDGMKDVMDRYKSIIDQLQDLNLFDLDGKDITPGRLNWGDLLGLLPVPELELSDTPVRVSDTTDPDGDNNRRVADKVLEALTRYMDWRARREKDFVFWRNTNQEDIFYESGTGIQLVKSQHLNDVAANGVLGSNKNNRNLAAVDTSAYNGSESGEQFWGNVWQYCLENAEPILDPNTGEVVCSQYEQACKAYEEVVYKFRYSDSGAGYTEDNDASEYGWGARIWRNEDGKLVEFGYEDAYAGKSLSEAPVIDRDSDEGDEYISNIQANQERMLMETLPGSTQQKEDFVFDNYRLILPRDIPSMPTPLVTQYNTQNVLTPTVASTVAGDNDGIYGATFYDTDAVQMIYLEDLIVMLDVTHEDILADGGVDYEKHGRNFWNWDSWNGGNYREDSILSFIASFDDGDTMTLDEYMAKEDSMRPDPSIATVDDYIVTGTGLYDYAGGGHPTEYGTLEGGASGGELLYDRSGYVYVTDTETGACVAVNMTGDYLANAQGRTTKPEKVERCWSLYCAGTKGYVPIYAGEQTFLVKAEKAEEMLRKKMHDQGYEEGIIGAVALTTMNGNYSGYNKPSRTTGYHSAVMITMGESNIPQYDWDDIFKWMGDHWIQMKDLFKLLDPQEDFKVPDGYDMTNDEYVQFVLDNTPQELIGLVKKIIDSGKADDVMKVMDDIMNAQDKTGELSDLFGSPFKSNTGNPDYDPFAEEIANDDTPFIFTPDEFLKWATDNGIIPPGTVVSDGDIYKMFREHVAEYLAQTSGENYVSVSRIITTKTKSATARKTGQVINMSGNSFEWRVSGPENYSLGSGGSDMSDTAHGTPGAYSAVAIERLRYVMEDVVTYDYVEEWVLDGTDYVIYKRTISGSDAMLLGDSGGQNVIRMNRTLSPIIENSLAGGGYVVEEDETERDGDGDSPYGIGTRIILNNGKVYRNGVNYGEWNINPFGGKTAEEYIEALYRIE